MQKTKLTKAGAKMNMAIYQRVLDVMTHPENDGASQEKLAQQANVSTRTLRNYLTPETWEDIRKLRLRVVKDALNIVDQAMYAKAIKGDTTAARLIYSRWEDMREAAEDLPTDLPKTLEEIEQELSNLKHQINELEKTA